MNIFQVIGNLGADARIIDNNGSKFVSFNVADTQSWTDESGIKHESTDWISCTINGDGGNLLPYLTKGKMVWVSGRISTRIYSSPKDRQMKAGLNLYVRNIELIGGSSDGMPKNLVTTEGELLNVSKAYYIDHNKAKELGATNTQDIMLMGERGGQYSVTKDGWVTPIQDQNNGNKENQAETPANQAQ